ncbi:hypothetical protein FBU30_004625 [Linnemannia zychae]|nr:hypothetical protein FBU30_004625 [Linnemannia zychae]
MMESIEQSDDLVQDSCWANKLDQDQDFEMNAPTYLHQEYTYTDHGRGKWCQENIMTIPAADEELYMQDEDDVIMDLINEDSNSVRSESCNAEASLNYEANPKIPTGSLSRAYSSSSSSPQSYRSVLYDSENRSGLESTPLGISIPTIESNTTGGNSSGKEWQLGKGSSKSSSRDNSNAYDNDSSSSSLKMKVSSSTTLSSSSMPLDFAFRHPKEHHTQQEKEQDFLPQQSISCNESTTSATPPKNASTNITNASSTTDSSTTATVQASNSGATDTAGAQQRLQQILNRNDKIAFLTKYTDRMHLKLQALGIEDWGQGDIQRKKTYQLMIQHNDKTGEKDLVNFYLGRYGGSVTRSTEANTMQEDQQPTVETDTEAGMVTLGQQEGEQRTPLVAQA